MRTRAIGAPSDGFTETNSPPEGSRIHWPQQAPELRSMIPRRWSIACLSDWFTVSVIVTLSRQRTAEHG